MRTVLLDSKRHNRTVFDCGVEPLNKFLRTLASQQARSDNSRTYVLEHTDQPNRIIGYYTLAVAWIDLSPLPSDLQKRHHNAQMAAGLIARLAVDRIWTGQGYGEWLLVNALNRLLEAGDIVGFPLIVADEKIGEGKFYQRFGFKPFFDEPDHLFITTVNARATIL